MISLAYSAGTCIGTRLTKPNSCRCLLPITDDSAAKSFINQFSSNHEKTSFHPLVLLQNEKTDAKFKRREAIGLALGFGLFHIVWEPQTITAAEAVSCELTVAPSGLAFCDIVVGTGPQAAKGQLIKAHYIGKLENGKIFDSSYNRGKPLTFRVGVGEVIKGWDDGILGGDGVPPMLAGGKRILKLPPELGYGTRGAGCRGGSCIIPPDSVLLFDVEFISKVRLYDHRLLQSGASQSYDGYVNSHTRTQLGVDLAERFLLSGGEDWLWSIKSGELLFEDKFSDPVLSTVCYRTCESTGFTADKENQYMHDFSLGAMAWIA